MEALPDGGVLEGESQIIGLIGSEDLSMVEASMLQNDAASVMMGFVGDDDEALSVAFSNTFSNASSTTTTPSSASRPSPPSSSYTIVSSHSTTAPSVYSTSSAAYTTHSPTPPDRGGSSVVELTGHQHPLPTPLLLTHQQHPQHHHHPPPPPPPQHLHSHPLQQHPHHHHIHPRNPPTQPQGLPPPPPSQHHHGTPSYYHQDHVSLLIFFFVLMLLTFNYCTPMISSGTYVMPSSLGSSVSGEGYECGECGMVCRTRGGLRKHLATEHQPDEPEPAETIPKQYTCTMPLCNFSTIKRDTYDLHIASHIADGWTPTGKKRHNKNPLQRHRYNKEELACPMCEYSCTVEKSFRRHLKSHESGQRNLSKFSCCICGKDRPTESELKKHTKKHRLGKYYRCDICKFQTVQLKKLIQHRRMHTGEKPHLCPFCPYRAARRDNLRSHVRRMHKRENMYGDTFTPRPMLLAEADIHDHTGKPVEQDPQQQQQPQPQQQPPPHHHQPPPHHPHSHSHAHHHHHHNPHQQQPQPQVPGMSMVGPPPSQHQQPHASIQPPL
ncbi:zinc finger protein 652-B-like [Macrobrachium rosenbergii]|uniref:zinc finger protein 652-B-like n=1 Tax=Macrobrachium rosenbergii TaxID=79674 RepID=UPI0034D66BE5